MPMMDSLFMVHLPIKMMAMAHYGALSQVIIEAEPIWQHEQPMQMEIRWLRTVSATYPIGYFREDYEYIARSLLVNI